MKETTAAKNKGEGNRNRQEGKCTRGLLAQATGARLLESSSKSVWNIQHFATSTSVSRRRRARSWYEVLYLSRKVLFGDNFSRHLHCTDACLVKKWRSRVGAPLDRDATREPAHTKCFFGSALGVRETLLQSDNRDAISRYPDAS